MAPSSSRGRELIHILTSPSIHRHHGHIFQSPPNRLFTPCSSGSRISIHLADRSLRSHRLSTFTTGHPCSTNVFLGDLWPYSEVNSRRCISCSFGEDSSGFYLGKIGLSNLSTFSTPISSHGRGPHSTNEEYVCQRYAFLSIDGNALPMSFIEAEIAHVASQSALTHQAGPSPSLFCLSNNALFDIVRIRWTPFIFRHTYSELLFEKQKLCIKREI